MPSKNRYSNILFGSLLVFCSIALYKYLRFDLLSHKLLLVVSFDRAQSRSRLEALLSGQTILQHKTLFKNPDENDPTEIEVIDPTHPLFGRHFPLLSVSSPLHGPGHVLVSYREYMVLRLPVSSTTLAASRPVLSIKLTHAAVKELVTIA